MVDFDKSMLSSANYMFLRQKERWNLLKRSYLLNMEKVGIAIIPRIIHQIWLGGPIPDKIAIYIDTIKRANPNFEHKLWTNKEADEFEYPTKKQFYQTPNFGQRSDILRYAILEKIGGIYADVDFIGRNSFQPLVHLNLFAGVAYDSNPVLFNGLIGAVPNHPIIHAINKEIQPRYGDGTTVMESTGPYFFTRKFFEHFDPLGKVVALPLSYFYPYPNFNQDKHFGDDISKYVKPETICVHLWHSNWN